MSPRRLARHRSQPKHTFSNDEEEINSFFAYNPLPTPSPSATPPARPSHSRKRSPSHVRRPRNAFIIFRSEFCQHQKMSENGIESDHRHISRIAAHVWNNLNDDQKVVYKGRAEAEKAAHKAAHPGYQYTPVGKPKGAAKRKVKRHRRDNPTRCRQLAELLISGVDGKAFQQAAKGLDEGVVEVELTTRTSQPARKRPSRASRNPSHSPAFTCQVSAEVKIKQESPSPPPSLGLWTPCTSISDMDAPHGSPDAESQTHVDTPALLEKCGSEVQGSGSALQLASCYVPMDFFPLPVPSNDVEHQFAANPHMGPAADSGFTLAQFSRTTPVPTSLGAFHMPRPLPMQAAQGYDLADGQVSSWSAITSASPAWPVTPQPPSPVSTDYDLQAVENLASEVSITFTNPWNAGADAEACRVHQTGELTFSYPDDTEVDFDEYLTGL